MGAENLKKNESYSFRDNERAIKYINKALTEAQNIVTEIETRSISDEERQDVLIVSKIQEQLRQVYSLLIFVDRVISLGMAGNYLGGREQFSQKIAEMGDLRTDNLRASALAIEQNLKIPHISVSLDTINSSNLPMIFDQERFITDFFEGLNEERGNSSERGERKESIHEQAWNSKSTEIFAQIGYLTSECESILKGSVINPRSKKEINYDRRIIARDLLMLRTSLSRGTSLIDGSQIEYFEREDKQERVEVLQSLLLLLNDAIDDLPEEQESNSKPAQAETIVQWRADESLHPEICKELKAAILASEIELTEIRTLLSSGFNDDIVVQLLRINNLISNVQALRDRVIPVRDFFKNHPTDIDGSEKARLIQDLYVSTADRFIIDAAALFDQHKAERSSFFESTHPELLALANFTAAPIPGLRNFNADIATLNRLLVAARGAVSTVAYDSDHLSYFDRAYFIPAQERIALLEEKQFDFWSASLESITPNIIPKTSRLFYESFLARFVNGNEVFTLDNRVELDTAITNLERYINGAPVENDNQAHSARQKELLNTKYLEQLKGLVQATSSANEKKEAGRFGTSAWFREQLDLLDSKFQSYTSSASAPIYNEITAELKKNERRAGKLTPAEYQLIKDEVDARRELNGVYLMIELPNTGGRFVKNLKPNEVDLRSTQLGFLFRMPGVADSWRTFDRILQHREPGMEDIDAANFVESRDKCIGYVANKIGNPTAASIAYRLSICFMRPSEFDRTQKWGNKDEWRQLFHQLEFRHSYGSKSRNAGPISTIYSYFDRPDNPGYNQSNPPVITLPNIHSLPKHDPGWDMYPGFFHFCYEGRVIQRGDQPVRVVDDHLRDANGRIQDFAKLYTDANGDLRVEDIPWDRLPEDILQNWYGKMQSVAYEVQSLIMEKKYTAGDLKRESFYEGMMNKWQYIEPYLYGLRDLATYPVEGRVAEVVKQRLNYFAEQFRAQWLAGVIFENFTAPQEGAANWTVDELRDIVRAAVNANFISKESGEKITDQSDRWRRQWMSIIARIAARLKKPNILGAG